MGALLHGHRRRCWNVVVSKMDKVPDCISILRGKVEW